MLGSVLEAESHYSVGLCQKLNTVTQDTQSAWEYVQQAHQRLGTQLSGLKPLMSGKGRGDLFATFVNQPPQGLRPVA